MSPEHRWERVLRQDYGLEHARLLDQRSHFSTHFIVSAYGHRYVLSRATRDPARLPFDLQFVIIDRLNASGATIVRPPVRTVEGRPFVERFGHYWHLRAYRFSDPVRNWRDLSTEAAQVLAAIHSAGKRADPQVSTHAHIDYDRLSPYYRPADRFLRSLPALRARIDHTSGRADLALVRWAVDDLAATGAAALRACRDADLLGIAHHDYRPDNVLTRRGRIIEVIDWDCAFDDYQLYDVAFAALHFSRDQPTHDHVDPIQIQRFFETYLSARGIAGLPAGTVSWFLRLTAVKRIMINGMSEERMTLLRSLLNIPESEFGTAVH